MMAGFDGQEELFFGDLLKQFRRRKRLTQQQLAQRLEVTRETVSLWERGNYKPEAEGILYQIVDVLVLTDQEQAQLFQAYTITALATSFHNPPLKRNLYFTGRSFQLNQIHTLLMVGKQVALTQAISGLGGIGKTQLALEYAYRYQKSYHDIFWASADTEETLMASYVRFAEVLHLPEAKEADQNKVKEAVRRWFQQHTNWLLILDNIEDLHLLPPFVPEDRQGAVLLTTRRQVTEPVAQALELEVLPEEDAILFLLKRTKVLALDASLERASRDELEAARAITHLLGRLPLALDQAGAYILETPCSFAEYLSLLQTYQDRLLQRRIGEGIPTDHPASVTTTFRLNFQQVQQRSNAAAELLRLCAFLAPDAIPEKILTTDGSTLGPVLTLVTADAFLFNQAIEILRAYSLVRRDPMVKMLSIHRLVQAVLQNSLEEAERRSLAERMVLAMNAAFPHVEPNAEHDIWLQYERLLPHALLATHYINQYQIASEEAGQLLHEVASYLGDRARYAEAEMLYQRALSIRELWSGSKSFQMAASLNSLAAVYTRQGKYAQAEPLYQQARQIFEHLFGADHPETARCLNNLANLFADQGKYNDAEPLYQRALHIWQRELGQDHPLVGSMLSNLAGIYQEQGNDAQVEPLYQQARQIFERLGPDHRQLAPVLNNLANHYQKQGKYTEAEPLYQQARQIFERHLGLEHPMISYPLNGLAELYYTQGRNSEAESLFQQVLRIREQGLGSEHPETAETMYDLAQLWETQGNSEEAKSWYARALVIREHSLGKRHPKTTETRMRLIALLHSIEQHEEAAQLENPDRTENSERD